ncbi:MAG TPA: YceI family protein [Anaerolineae bacterium]|nr:YceI family protein [Anaerolineae bacterium]
MKKFLSIGIIALGIALGIVACGGTQTATQPPVSLATLAPTAATQPTTQTTAPTAAPTTAAASTTAPQTAAPIEAASTSDASNPSNGPLPQSLKDIPDGQVYTFVVDPSQTTVEYAVNEVLFGNKQITRGSTNSVQGQFQVSLQNGKPTINMSQLQVDLRTLKSDNGMRDEAIRRQWLESNKYPMAVFVAKEVQGFPTDAVQGQSYSFKVIGDMTIRNITKPVTFDITVSVNGTTLTGEGTTQIYMKDFGFDPPEILGRFTVSDPATITIKGVANYVES